LSLQESIQPRLIFSTPRLKPAQQANRSRQNLPALHWKLARRFIPKDLLSGWQLVRLRGERVPMLARPLAEAVEDLGAILRHGAFCHGGLAEGVGLDAPLM
jgi:hypothetical protein